MQGRFIKLAIAAVVLQAIPCMSASAAVVTVANNFINVPNLAPGFEFNVSGLYLQPSGRNFDYAILTNPLPAPTPHWDVKSVNPSHAGGFTIGAGYIFPYSGNDVQLNWSHLRSRDSSAVQADTTQFVGSFFQTGPNSIDIRQAYGKQRTAYDVVNLDVGQYINFCSSLQTRFFAGISWVSLEQDLDATFQDYTGAFNVHSDSQSDYNGLGPRLGAHATYELGNGFGVVGQMAGSLYIGKEDPQVDYTSSSNTLVQIGIVSNHQSISSSNSTQVVPALDAKLGLNYVYGTMWGNITLEAGYQVASYINALTEYSPNSVVTNFQTGSITLATLDRSRSNFSVSGPYLDFSMKI